MKILYVTRHFNHSGYLILQRLIDEGVPIQAVLVEDRWDIYKIPLLRCLAKLWYKLTILFYRGRELKTLNSEELLARNNGLRVLKTKTMKNDQFYEELSRLNPDLIVLGGGWHELIPERVFKLPKYGCINTHPSLLPEFRGTSITRWQVLHGVRYSGSTIHFVDDRFDTGGAIAQKRIEVNPEWTPQELFYQLGVVGADLMVDLLKKYWSNFNPPVFFPEHNQKYYKYFSRWKWNDESLKINLNKGIRQIYFFVLANSQESYKYSGPYLTVNGKDFIVREAKLHPDSVLYDMQGDDEIQLGEDLCLVRFCGCKVFLRSTASDEHCMEIVRVQAKKRFKWSRATTANIIFEDSLKTNN